MLTVKKSEYKHFLKRKPLRCSLCYGLKRYKNGLSSFFQQFFMFVSSHVPDILM